MAQQLKLLLSVALVVMNFCSCLPDRDLFVPNGPTDTTSTGSHILLINEIVSNGSLDITEFGSAEDWIELYNPGAAPVVVGQGEFYLTDAAGTDDLLFALPPLTVPSKGFIVVWCDGMDTIASQIHSNFKLSSSGETIALTRIIDGSPVQADLKAYTANIPDGNSEGRTPDGGAAWAIFSVPTPGQKNQ